MATVTFSAADDVLYAYLAGEIDHDAAQGLRIQLDDALLTRSPRILVMDLGGVGFMDSSGIGLILGRQRCARTLGGSLRIQHAPEQLFDLAQNDRHSVGGKTDATRLIKAVIRFYQPHTAGAVEVVVFNASPPEPSGTGMHQPQILLDECAPPGLVRYHCDALFLFIM